MKLKVRPTRKFVMPVLQSWPHYCCQVSTVGRVLITRPFHPLYSAEEKVGKEKNIAFEKAACEIHGNADSLGFSHLADDPAAPLPVQEVQFFDHTWQTQQDSAAQFNVS